MSDENNDSIIPVGEPADPEAAVRTVGDTMEALLETAGVDKVYGSPIRRGEVTIIPSAEVLAGLGFGVGFGSGESSGEEEGASADRGGGGGGGGWGRTFSRPVAVVVVESGGVRVEPVVDATKVALAALTAFGFMFTTMRRMKNPHRGKKADAAES